MTDQPRNDDPDGPEADEDATWRDIVENFGDRVEVPPEPDPRVDTGLGRPTAIPRPADDRADDRDQWDPNEHYTPPAPPPAPRPQGPRGLAWLGLFGAPLVMLVCLVLQIQLPTWAAFLLFCAFVGGFGFLVATMRKHDDSDPWDDGAVV